MIFLVLDTATDMGVAGLFQDGRLLAKREFAAAFANSKQLLPLIDALFQEAGIEKKDLSFIATGKGPGSYTGIRVSVAFAKAVSSALNIPLVAVSSLRAFVSHDPLIKKFVAAIDAKIGGVYAILGELSDTEIRFKGEDALYDSESFQAMCQGVDCVITPNKAPIARRLEGKDHLIQERIPSIEMLGLQAYEAYRQGRICKDGHVEIAYLRKTQAEIEKGEKLKK